MGLDWRKAVDLAGTVGYVRARRGTRWGVPSRLDRPPQRRPASVDGTNHRAAVYLLGSIRASQKPTCQTRFTYLSELCLLCLATQECWNVQIVGGNVLCNVADILLNLMDDSL